VIGGALAAAAVEAGELEAIGITNQRETTVVWDRETGEPLYNAIVWQDTRTGPLVRELAGDGGSDRLREAVGLPLSTYFSGPKISWILDQRRRRPRPGGGRRAGLRDDGQLAPVEPHRRRRRRASTRPT
jgi:glycerol kinase